MDGSILIRPIVVMSVKRQGNINCSAKCERDFHCSKALLLAKNAPALASVKGRLKIIVLHKKLLVNSIYLYYMNFTNI